MRLRLASALVALVLSTGCLGGSTEPIGAATVEGTTFAPSLGVDLASSTRLVGGLYYRDLSVGTGRTVAVNDSLAVNYVGSLSTGSTFETSQTPFRFRLGVGRVIPGWDQGLVGMKVGGQRQLLIPPTLAYGFTEIRNSAGVTIIPANSVLVFNITAISAVAP